MPSKPQFVGEGGLITIGELGRTQSGGTPSSKHPEYFEGDIPWIGTTALRGGVLNKADAVKLITADAIAHSATKLVPAGSLMVGIRVGVGKVGINAIPMCTSQDIVSIIGIDDEDWNKEYVSLALQFKAPLLAAKAQGATITGITSKTLKSMTIPVRSLSEQNVIVGQLNKIKKQLVIANEQLVKLDQLIKSRFVEMFLSSSWPIATIGECSTDIRYGTSEKASAEGEYVYLRMNNMGDDGALNLSDTKRITLEGKALSNCLVRKGDLLFNRTNSREKVGKTCVFCFDEPMVIAGYIIRVRLDDRVDSVYLAAYMNLNSTKALLRGMAKGAVHQANINAKQLASIEFPLADIDVQKQFASFVSQVDKSRFLPQSAFHHRERPKHPSPPRARGCLHEAEQRSIDRGINKRANSEPCNIASSLGTVGLKHVHKTMSSRRNLAINN